jgi:hypothetical protein
MIFIILDSRWPSWLQTLLLTDFWRIGGYSGDAGRPFFQNFRTARDPNAVLA